MYLRKERQALLAVTFIIIASLAAGAQPAGNKQPGTADVVPLPAPSPLARLLPDTLAGQRATSEMRLTGNLSDFVGDNAAVYQEYLVTSAASREYGGSRIEVFHTQNQFAAFGLFTFNTGAGKSKPLEVEPGSGGARSDNELVFSKGNFFVRVADANSRGARASFAVRQSLARAVAEAIVLANPEVTQPSLLDSLPPSSMVPGSRRYFLGPESLNAYIKHAREMFDFVGDTEAVVAEYTQAARSDSAEAQQTGADQAHTAGPGNASAAAGSDLLKFVIVEYHTPQFATDAMARASGFISSLTEDEQQQIILKRTGNYIVEALNVRDREFAGNLVNSVQYPYTVKWLRNPLWPTNDPFRMQKTAQMLLSTFGLLGLILLTVLGAGTVFGTTIFLKRRKRQQEVFSDAGGMLRLDIDQIESAMLGLPPQRSNED
jgi:hypothetical protein